MRTPRVLGLLALSVAGVIVLAGCAGVTEESLDAAEEVGAAPAGFTAEVSGAASGLADLFTVTLTWDEVRGADGYQLQVMRENTWSTVSDEDEGFFGPGTSRSEAIFGYDEAAEYRVRAVFEADNAVSPWADPQRVETDPGNVLYEVEGTAGSAAITLRTNTGTEQSNISVPLTTTTGEMGLWLQGTNMTPYLSAQATTVGSITCRITMKGTVVSENTSTGRGAIATCSP